MTSMPPTLAGIRVMQVLEATAGGTARHLIEIASGLRAAGAEVHVVCALRRDAGFGAELARLRAVGVTVTELDMRRRIAPLADAQAVWRLARLFEETRPDVIHLHSSKAGGIGRLAAALRPMA